VSHAPLSGAPRPATGRALVLADDRGTAFTTHDGYGVAKLYLLPPGKWYGIEVVRSFLSTPGVIPCRAPRAIAPRR
jgi:hypothetical protein